MKKIVLLPGDGIGPEVTTEARKILNWISEKHALHFQIEESLIGGASLDALSSPLSEITLELCRRADAILLGAVGGPKWDDVAYDLRPEAGLLALRKELDLFANLRPAKVFDALIDASTLKPEVVKGLDIMIVRELTGGIYFGTPRGIETLEDGQRRGINTQTYTTQEIHRVARVAFQLARKRRGVVCSCDKANVMESGKLWREEVTALHAAEGSNITLSHMYADNCAMQLLRNPRQFDVIVTDNLFGDILSDQASMLTGSLGMLPSASLGTKHALYEPVHGAAPDIAGQNKANPLAAILSVAMMMRYSFNLPKIAEQIEQAVELCLAQGQHTADLDTPNSRKLSTSQAGDAVLAQMENLYEQEKRAC